MAESRIELGLTNRRRRVLRRTLNNEITRLTKLARVSLVGSRAHKESVDDIATLQQLLRAMGLDDEGIPA